MYSIVIPNKYRDIIKPLLYTIKVYEGKPDVVIVGDNHSEDHGFRNVRADGDFSFPRSANIGINATYPNDVILINDDVRLTMPTFEMLQFLAYSDDQIGILSPMVDGGCGNLLMKPALTDLWKKPENKRFHYCNARAGDRVTFACVYIKRSLIETIGLFDEGFSAYGFDDADMSIRCVRSGWKLAITNRLTVKHGDGGFDHVRGSNWNSSFVRKPNISAKPNLEYLQAKYPELIRKPKELCNIQL